MAETIASQLQSLILSAHEVKAMTGWPEHMISEWLNMIENAALISGVVDGIDTDIESLELRIKKNEDDIASLDTRVEDNEDDITDINAEIVTINQNVSALQTAVSALQLAVSNLQTSVTANTNSINDIESKITGIEQLTYVRGHGNW